MAAPRAAFAEQYKVEFEYLRTDLDVGISHLLFVRLGPANPEESGLGVSTLTSIDHTDLVRAVTKLGLDVLRDQLNDAEKALEEYRIEQQGASTPILKNIKQEFLQNFKFERIQEGSSSEKAINRLELLACQAHAEELGKKYAPPTFDECFEAYARALSRFESAPTGDELIITNKDKTKFAHQLFGNGFDSIEDRSILTRLEQRIAGITDKPVTLKPAHRNRFKALLKGPGKYLELTIGLDSELLAIGPYNTPFNFDRDNRS